MKKTANVLFTLLFALALGTVAVVTLAQSGTVFSFFENRNLAKAPEYSREALLDGSYFTDWEDFSTDHALGRAAMIRLSTRLRMETLRLPVVNEVVITGNRLLHFSRY